MPKISVSQAIKSCPLLLGLSVNKLKLVVEQLGDFGIRNQKLGKVIATSPQLLLQKPQEFHQVRVKIMVFTYQITNISTKVCKIVH